MFDEYESNESGSKSKWFYPTIILFIVIIFACIAYAIGIFSFSTTRKIDGEIFIVTQGRENLKLALVDVCVISDDKILNWIKSKETRAKVEIPKAEKTLKDAREKRDIAEKNYSEASALAEKYKNFFRYDPNNLTLEIYEREKDNAENSLKTLEEKTLNLNRAESAYDYWTSPKYYLDDLNQCDIKAQTNSDGKFTLKIPDSKKYAIAAQTSRKILNDTEFYQWLFWLDSDLETITLNNKNLMEENSTQNVVKIGMK